MGSRWNHFIIQIATLICIFVLSIVSTVFTLDILYNKWLLDRETRLIFTTFMMSFQVPFIFFLWRTHEKSEDLLTWLIVHTALFIGTWFWNIHHIFTIRHENGIFSSTVGTLFVFIMLFVSTIFLVAVIVISFRYWKLAHTPLERNTMPDLPGQVKIKRLPTIIYEPYKNLPGILCAVCLKSYKAGSGVKVLPGCYHTLHSYCANEWFKMNLECPHCRKEVSEDQLQTFKTKREPEENILQNIRDSKFAPTLNFA